MTWIFPVWHRLGFKKSKGKDEGGREKKICKKKENGEKKQAHREGLGNY